MTMPIDVSKELDNSPLGSFHIILVFLCGLVTVIDGFDLIAMGIVVPAVSNDWGLDPSVFGPALAAALFGVLFGSGSAGPLADYIGRRKTLIGMLLVTALFMLLTTTVHSMEKLIIYRFLTGFGAGGSIPIAIALTAEYMPSRYRNILITIMYSGAPLGTVFASIAAPWLINNYDWHALFVFGGALTLLITILLIIFLPESLRFLVNKGCEAKVVTKYFRKINPAMETRKDETFFVRENTHKGSAIKELFGGIQTRKTMLIWLIYFANQFIIFLLVLWMPTLFVEQGFSIETALYALAIFNIGGVMGGIFFGWLGDRRSAISVLMATYPLAAIGVAAIGVIGTSEAILYAVVFFTGIAAIGSSLLLGAMTASLYPTRARSTALGWALAIGRGGSITSPLIVGAALAIHWSTQNIFFVAAVAPLICAGGIFMLSKIIAKEQPGS